MKNKKITYTQFNGFKLLFFLIILTIKEYNLALKNHNFDLITLLKSIKKRSYFL